MQLQSDTYSKGDPSVLLALGSQGPLANRELDILRDALREHVDALAVDIGPRTPLDRDTLVGAANYIHSVFEEAGLSVRHGGLYLLRCRRSLRHCPRHAGCR
jgi:hypothetical protein